MHAARHFVAQPKAGVGSRDVDLQHLIIDPQASELHARSRAAVLRLGTRHGSRESLFLGVLGRPRRGEHDRHVVGEVHVLDRRVAAQVAHLELARRRHGLTGVLDHPEERIVEIIDVFQVAGENITVLEMDSKLAYQRIQASPVQAQALAKRPLKVAALRLAVGGLRRRPQADRDIIADA